MIQITLNSRLLVLGLLSILSSSTLALDETSGVSSPVAAVSGSATGSSSSGSSATAPNIQALRYMPVYDRIIGGKRAYSLRLENKRLPLLYQFGLGKRLANDDKTRRLRKFRGYLIYDKIADVGSRIGIQRGQAYSFGLGKRSQKPYSFGLGKRGYEDERLGASVYTPNLIDLYAQKLLEQKYLETKRAGGSLNFGLGKRDSEFNYLRDYDLQQRLPIKQSRDSSRYQFGLGKRSEDDYEEEGEEEEEEFV